jgi:hypothetical protein
MSNPTDFSQAIHSPEWWDADDAAFGDQLSSFEGIKLADLDPATAAQIGSLAISELIYLRGIVKALALERKPGRPKHGEPRPRRERPTDPGRAIRLDEIQRFVQAAAEQQMESVEAVHAYFMGRSVMLSLDETSNRSGDE